MTTSATYAYIHHRPDGAPFYVGKGTLRRAKCLSDRNPWHARIVPETIEKMRIATLSNPVRYWLGKKRSEETKLKISETKSRQLHHDD